MLWSSCVDSSTVARHKCGALAFSLALLSAGPFTRYNIELGLAACTVLFDLAVSICCERSLSLPVVLDGSPISLRVIESFRGCATTPPPSNPHNATTITLMAPLGVERKGLHLTGSGEAALQECENLPLTGEKHRSTRRKPLSGPVQTNCSLLTPGSGFDLGWKPHAFLPYCSFEGFSNSGLALSSLSAVPWL